MSSPNQGVELGAPTVITEAPSLERAFLIQTDRHTARTGRAESDWTYHHAPDTEESPTNRLLIVGGLGGVETAYKNVAEMITANGVNVITMNLPTYQHWHHQYHRDHFLHPERLLAQMVGRVIRDANAKYGFVPTDAAGHSTGGPAIAQAAARSPEQFSSITLWHSAGTTKGGIIRLGSRIPAVAMRGVSSHQKLRENLQAHVPEIASEYLNYGKNVPRRLLEAIAVSRSDIRETLNTVYAAGIKIGGVLAESDEFFPHDEAAKTIQQAGGIIVSLAGCHLAPVTLPEEVAEAQLYLLRHFRETVSTEKQAA